MNIARTWVAMAFCWAGLALVASSSARAEPGDVSRLIGALEQAPRVVVARVHTVSRLEHAGYLASIEVERTLRGPIASSEQEAVVWEEPAPSLAPRLEQSHRVLLALEAMPTASIWKVRIPDEMERAAATALAEGGEGYLDRPRGGELNTLEHYLALSPSARAGDAGVAHLARMAASAQARLARAAVARLAQLPDLNAHLDAAGARALVAALLREQEGDVGPAVLALVEARRPSNMRSALASRIEAEQEEAPAILLSALAAIDERMPDERALALLDSPDEERRLAAVRWARGEASTARLRDLSRHDPASAVRAAAIRRLARLESQAALPEALDGLADPAAEVRLAAAESIAAMGPETIPALRDVIDSDDANARQVAIATLGLMGEPARQDLIEIAETNPDAGLRALAGIALGLPIGHQH